MPVTMTAFTIGAFSMIGVPAVAGFTSKWYMVVGSLEADSLAILMVLLASTVLNAAYFLPIVFRAFFKAPSSDEHFESIKEAPAFVLIPLSLTAVLSVVIGIWPDLFISIIGRVF